MLVSSDERTLAHLGVKFSSAFFFIKKGQHSGGHWMVDNRNFDYELQTILSVHKLN